MKNKKCKFKVKLGFNVFTQRRKIEPVGRLILFGKELTIEQTKNYFQSLK